MAVPPPSKPERGSKLLPVRSSWLLEARLFGSGPPSGCAVYEVGASLLVSAADCSAGDSAACSAGGCSATGSADCGAAGSSVGAGASGSRTGCSVTTLPSFAVIVSSFIGGEGFAASSSHACAVRTLEGDVALGLDIARQSGWEARDNQDWDSMSQRDDHCRKNCWAQENRTEKVPIFLGR